VPTSSRLLRVSTDMFPEKERLSAFREEFVRKILTMDMIDHSGGCPRADLSFVPLGPAAVGTLASAPAEFIREKHHLKDGTDGFILEIVGSGPIVFAQAGEEHAYEAGSAAFIDHARPKRAFGPRNASVRNVTVNAAALKTLVCDPEDLAGRPIRPGPALRLLDSYLQSLAALDEPPPPDLASVIGAHLLDLVAAVLGPSRQAAETVAKRSVRAARVQAVITEIANRFNDPGFNVDGAARALGLSRRYVQELLEETGKPFTEHVQERRLGRAFALLTDRRCDHLPIIDIAYASGFGDVSHFNRMFRRRFGDTPSGVRGAAATEELSALTPRRP
jgi:AraC-like DNA-binding protein